MAHTGAAACGTALAVLRLLLLGMVHPAIAASSANVGVDLNNSTAPVIAWFGLSRVVGDFLGNATSAALAGYNTMAGSGIGCTAFLNGSSDLPGGPWYNATEMKRVESARAALRADVAAVQAERAAGTGLGTFWASYEALSFPARLVAAYASDMVDPNQTACIGYHRSPHGCISFARPRTRQVFGLLLDEVFAAFPEVDGLVVRYGENSPCAGNVGNAPWDPGNPVQSLADFLNVLRDELCVRRNKTVVFRTWDTSTDRLHANRTFYEAVTSLVAPHSRLLFSVKHTALDFWRRTRPNPTVGAGAHRQLVEACVGNLFQGMGAYPSYVVDGLVNGFEEWPAGAVATDTDTDTAAATDAGGPDTNYHVGLAAWAASPTFAGVFPVTQGSFSFPGATATARGCDNCSAGTVPFPWAWPWLEFTVLARWVRDNVGGGGSAVVATAAAPARPRPAADSEAAAFAAVVQEAWGLSAADAAALRAALVLAMRGNLLAETVGEFDAAVTAGVVRPSANFMVHNSLAGLFALGDDGHCNAGPGVPGSNVSNACEVVPWLVAQGPAAVEAALAEKAEAVATADRVAGLLANITTFPADGAVRRHVAATAAYAQGLFRVVEAGWIVILQGYQLDKQQQEHGGVVSSSSSNVHGEGRGLSADHGGGGNRTRLCQAAAAYDSAWATLWALRRASPDDCPTLYDDEHWAYAPESPATGAGTGLGADVRRLRSEYCAPAPAPAPGQGGQCQCDAGDYWCAADSALRRNFNCSGSAVGKALWKKLSNDDEPSRDDCTALAVHCAPQPPALASNATCDDSCYDFCWRTDVGDCADFDDENSFCVSVCQDYCLAARCAARPLRACEAACGAQFMVDRGPFTVDFVQYSMCVADNCTSVPISPWGGRSRAT